MITYLSRRREGVAHERTARKRAEIDQVCTMVLDGVSCAGWCQACRIVASMHGSACGADAAVLFPRSDSYMLGIGHSVKRSGSFFCRWLGPLQGTTGRDGTLACQRHVMMFREAARLLLGWASVCGSFPGGCLRGVARTWAAFSVRARAKSPVSKRERRRNERLRWR